MPAFGQMQGARLEFVVRPLKGKMSRPVHSMEKGKIVTTTKSVDAGFIVYTPMGQTYRLTKEELVQRGYDRQPEIMNFDQVKDTKSPAGRFKHAMTDLQRKQAWSDLEKQVIRSCERKHGAIVKDQKEEVNDSAAA